MANKKYEIGDKVSVMMDGEEKFLEYCGMSDEYILNGNRRKGIWKCYCDLKFNCLNASIRSAHTKSCGHSNLYNIGDKVEINIDGEIKYLEYLGMSNKKTPAGKLNGEWKCYCNNKFICLNDHIKRGNTKSCGHNRKTYIVGEIVQVKIKKEIKELKYLGDSGKRNKFIQIIGEWLCFCGDKFECLNFNITSGHSFSCGKRCWIKKYDNYSNTDLIRCTACNNYFTKDNFKWKKNGKINKYHCNDCRKMYKNNYQKNKRKNDPSFKLRRIISDAIRQTLKNTGNRKSKSTFEALNYTLEQLKQHIELLFESWMTWDNWTVYDPSTWNDNDQSTWTWNIDHIKPHSEFNYTSMEDQAFNDCWALSNLRPYSSKQNNYDGVNKIRHKKKGK